MSTSDFTLAPLPTSERRRERWVQHNSPRASSAQSTRTASGPRHSLGFVQAHAGERCAAANPAPGYFDGTARALISKREIN